ncbi:MAG: Asp23/Gls24 family envelope stress response protein [Oscillospiraceae bacterium]|nr:Asp23/Gls24 family envelope stress response protein [Oscillospiraceae bacterium]
MIRMENHLGLIEVSQDYFNEIIGNAVTSCYGVSGMANTNARQGLRSVLRKRQYVDQGVRVYKDGGGLMVDLHILVTYGLNISAIVRSIVNKVRYTVEDATGLEVRKVNVFVDGMLSREDG